MSHCDNSQTVCCEKRGDFPAADLGEKTLYASSLLIGLFFFFFYLIFLKLMDVHQKIMFFFSFGSIMCVDHENFFYFNYFMTDHHVSPERPETVEEQYL